ncbi:site-specific integrase [Pseudorhodobacter sp. E13]|nr:site-specific integrase [Pseudorhodobacter sp. E13]RUS63654.1 site-specific integrase [Pseudorhodobacter sp. E13]
MPDLTIGRLRGGFCVSWYEGGKRRRYQLEACSRKEAEAEALDLFNRHRSIAGALTVTDIWHAYREQKAGRQITERMKYSGKPVLAHFGAFRPDQISTELCREYHRKREALGRQPGTVWTELSHLRIALNWAVKQRLVEYTPPIERPTPPAPKDRYLTHAEIDRLLATKMEPHIRLAIILMLSTAARVTAVLELTWDRVDLDRGQIDLRKNATGPRKGRAVVPINAGLRDALQEAQQAALSDHVIEWAGGPVKSIKKGFASVATRAGLQGVTPHVLRHTCAVHMAEGGVPMAEISQYLGHSSTDITARVYARYSPQHLLKAAEIVDFTRPRVAV